MSTAPEQPDQTQPEPTRAPVPAPSTHNEFLVVGLGASAGGIKALQEFFTNTPPHTGAAYVVILHLSPEHESRLSEVLQAVTTMPVLRVTQGTKIEPDHIYVISPNTSLRMAGNMLSVSDVLRTEERRAPVDIFFRTLADTHGSRAVAVILSGTGPNGSNGLKQVKEYGGLAIAQEPGECEHDDMPRNAIATGLVDYILPVAEMPGRIQAYGRRRESTPPVVHAPDADAVLESLRDILTLVRMRTGQDFSHYKTATVLRRIERRQNLHELPDILAYARFLREHPDECVALLKELLISVTHFFRDPDAFLALERNIVPRLFHGKQAQDQVRVWVAGCATGEEAYSVAMLLAEAAGRAADEPGIQVFATDLDALAIGDAREAFYTDSDVADVSPARLRRFFVREAGGYRVRRELRELVLFAHHNVLKDPPFSHLDLVCCRNLLIYLTRSSQERLLETFNFALKPGGYLFLGTSESADGAGDMFAIVDKAAHIYESRLVSTRPLPPVPDRALVVDRNPPRPPELRQPLGPIERISAADLHQQLLEQYAPPSLVVTEEHQIVHLSDRVGRYLQLPGGEVSRDLLRLARPELRLELRTALFEAGRSRNSVEVRGIQLARDGHAGTVNIMVRPVLRESEPARGFFLVLFEEPDTSAQAQSPEPPIQLTGAVQPEAAQHLEEELLRVKAQLRATIDQYETQGEEAKASNEELQAVNEELRSAAEELETSKEELQSVNEELTTVNQELKIKIDELGLTNNDFQNLINSTDIGTIFLDRSLRVKLSTPRARDVFNLLPTDTGRPLSDITSRLAYDGLHQDVELVLDRLQTIEREVQSREGHWYLMRILPYRTTDERIEGVVMTFQDITARRRAELAVRDSEVRLRLLMDSVTDYAIFTLTRDGRIDSWSRGAERVFGYSEEEILGQQMDILFTPEDRTTGVPQAELARAGETGRAEAERWHVRKDGSKLYCTGVTTTLGEREGRGFAKIARDLTASREAAMALQRAQLELEDRIRERTHDLEVEIAEHTAAERRITGLVRQLVTAQEDERARVARDIHDHVGQQLTALRLSLERHEQACKAAGNGEQDLNKAQSLVREIDAALDFLAWELRPAALDDLGLVAALSRYLQAWSEHHQMIAEFRTTGLDNTRLAPEVETAFYRIAQEALNNAVKHAHASRVDVILERREGSTVLVIEDDGIGFDPASDGSKGLGLVGMRERAGLIGGAFQLESAIGKGTTIFVRIPLPAGSTANV